MANEEDITMSSNHFFYLFWHVILITAVNEIIHPNCLFNLIDKHLIKQFSHLDIHRALLRNMCGFGVHVCVHLHMCVCVFQPLSEQFSWYWYFFLRDQKKISTSWHHESKNINSSHFPLIKNADIHLHLQFTTAAH